MFTGFFRFAIKQVNSTGYLWLLETRSLPFADKSRVKWTGKNRPPLTYQRWWGVLAPPKTERLKNLSDPVFDHRHCTPPNTPLEVDNGTRTGLCPLTPDLLQNGLLMATRYILCQGVGSPTAGLPLDAGTTPERYSMQGTLALPPSRLAKTGSRGWSLAGC